MKNIHRFMLILGLLIPVFLFLTVYSVEVLGMRTARVGAPPSGQDLGKVKSQRDPEALRTAFREGVQALNDGKVLMASLFLAGLEDEYTQLNDYVLYYRIRAVLATGGTSEALLLARGFFDRYPESVLSSRVRMEGVKANLLLEQFDQACSLARDILGDEKDPEIKRQVTLLLGECHEGASDWQGAQAVYQDLAYEEPATAEGEEAEQRIASIIRETDRRPETPGEALFLTRVKALNRSLRFGGVIETCDAFQKAYPSGKDLDKALLLKARALMKSGRPKEGEALYEKLRRTAGEDSLRAEAAYSLGSYYWNRHENSRAKKRFKGLIKHYPGSEWARKARYALGRIYEAEVELSKAKDYYLSIGKGGSKPPLAAEGAWRAGWVEYKAGRYEKAREIFDLCMRRYPDSDVFADALYWKGRCEERLENQEKADKVFRTLLSDNSWEFYGVMARKRRASSVIEASGQGTRRAIEFPMIHPNIHTSPGTSLSYHLDRAHELIEIGFFKEAKEEIDALRTEASKNPKVRCYLGNLYEKSKSYYDSVRWMYRLNGDLCTGDAEAGPITFERYLYPLAFWEIVKKEAEKMDLDPFLILAVMRQESLFQPDVVSSADARGLMQIIPPTGKSLAQRMSFKDFTPEVLFDPETNIAFGSRYLGDLMKRSGGDLVRVLSSYNAGETRSDAWWKRHKHLDLDERIESITFRETKGYVKKVLRNLENYRRLYESPVRDSGKESVH